VVVAVLMVTKVKTVAENHSLADHKLLVTMAVIITDTGTRV
jgi:hypothetical protein